MADFVATDVTYTTVDKDRTENGFVKNVIKLEFGDGAITYAAGGIPITPADLGMAREFVKYLTVTDQGTSGFVFSYDRSAKKLVVKKEGDAGGALVEITGDAIAAQTLEVCVTQIDCDSHGEMEITCVSRNRFEAEALMDKTQSIGTRSAFYTGEQRRDECEFTRNMPRPDFYQEGDKVHTAYESDEDEIDERLRNLKL